MDRRITELSRTESIDALDLFVIATDIDTSPLTQSIRLEDLESSLNHNNLLNYEPDEHIDWTADQGATNIDAGNIPDLSGTYQPLDTVLTELTALTDPGADRVPFWNDTTNNFEWKDFANWDTAYGWGNHASAGYVTGTPWTAEGYLTEETDPVFSAWDKSTGISITESQISDLGTYSTDIHANIAALDLVSGTNTGDQDLSGYLKLDATNYDSVIFPDGKYVGIDQIRARDGDGLKLTDDGNNGIFIEDGGNVGIGTTGPSYKLSLAEGTTEAGGIGLGSDVVLYRSDASQLSLSLDGVERMLWVVNGGIGQFQMVGNGTAAVPKYSWSSDFDTGMFKPAEDTLAFTTGGTERIRINDTGNVGIGTTVPEARFQVTISNNTVTPFRFQTLGTAGEVNDALYAEFYGPTTRRAWYGFGASANPNFTFVNEMTNGDITFLPARNTIFRQGNVGIGTTAPGAKLDVEDSATPGGVLRLGNTDTTISTGEIAGKIEFYNADATYGAGVHAYIQSRALDSGANYALDFYTDDVNGPDHIMTMSGGNVGINETSPDYKLDVNGSFGFTPGSSVTPADNGDVIIEATNNTTLTFKLKGSDGTVRSGTVTLS